MKHKKLTILSLFIAMTTVLLCSCTSAPKPDADTTNPADASGLDSMSNNNSTSKPAGKEDTEREILTLMELINNEDKEQLFDHFSDYIKENYEAETKQQIDEFFSCIDGKIISHDAPKNLNYKEKSVYNDIITLYYSLPRVHNVITEGEQNLTLVFSYTSINEECPENEGITHITIHNTTEGNHYGDAIAEIGGEYMTKEQN